MGAGSARAAATSTIVGRRRRYSGWDEGVRDCLANPDRIGSVKYGIWCNLEVVELAEPFRFDASAAAPANLLQIGL